MARTNRTEQLSNQMSYDELHSQLNADQRVVLEELVAIRIVYGGCWESEGCDGAVKDYIKTQGLPEGNMPTLADIWGE